MTSMTPNKYIVVKVEGNTHTFSRIPFVHYSLVGAEIEAKRLSNKHR